LDSLFSFGLAILAFRLWGKLFHSRLAPSYFDDKRYKLIISANPLRVLR